MDADARLPLPPEGAGERRTRRHGRHQARTRTLVTFGLALCLAAAVPLLLLFAYDQLWQTGDGDDGVRAAADRSAAADQPVAAALLVLEDADRRVTGLTVLVPSSGGRGGAVLFVPTGAMVEVPSYGLDQLRAAGDLGGATLVEESVEALLEVRFDDVASIDPVALESLVGPAGTLAVDVPERVEDVAATGQRRVLFEEGVVPVAPVEVPQLLSAPGGQAELARLSRHRALWQAWLGAIAGRPDTAAPPAGIADGVVDDIVTLARGPVTYLVLPVERAGGDAEGEGEIYEVDRTAVRALVRELFDEGGAGAVPASLRVQVLNGTGEPGLAQAVAPKLVDAGAEETLVGDADTFDHRETEILYYDDDMRLAAETVRTALGVGRVVRSSDVLDGVDLTVVVGRDFSNGGA